jgi:hypothetical protein
MGRYGDIAAMEKQQSFVYCCLNMFIVLPMFATFGLKHVETNDLSHKVTRQICGMGKKNLTWPTNHYLLKKPWSL